MVDAGALLARLRDETEAMVAATERLAAIDSGSGDDHGIARVCEALGEILSAAGFAVRRRAEGGLSATLSHERAGRRSGAAARSRRHGVAGRHRAELAARAQGMDCSTVPASAT